MNVATQIRNLISRVPVNHLGLVEGIYRPDLLPAYPETASPNNNTVTDETIIDDPAPEAQTLPSIADDEVIEHAPQSQAPEESSPGSKPSGSVALSLIAPNREPLAQYEKEIKAAYTVLDYAEGFPTLEGMPFWMQLSFEPADAFFCFAIYLKLGDKGARRLIDILEDPDMKKLPVQARPTPKELEEKFHTYYWGQRVKAYDMFYMAHRRKERERRAFETEDSHYFRASKILAIFDEYIDANKDDLIETMTPKAAMEFAKTGMQIQRMSTGLDANGKQSSTDIPQGASVEVIMRSMVRETQSSLSDETANKADETAQLMDEKRQKLREIMKDPAMIERAQELIIKLTGQPAEQRF